MRSSIFRAAAAAPLAAARTPGDDTGVSLKLGGMD